MTRGNILNASEKQPIDGPAVHGFLVMHNFEWLHHAFNFEESSKRMARANPRDGVVSISIGGGKDIAVDFRSFYEADLWEQACIVKRGVNARLVDVLADSMQISRDKLIVTLGLAKTTILRKCRLQTALSSDESSRVVGMSKPIGQAQAMIEESGGIKDFAPAAWFARWLDQPLSALNGLRPGNLMDTGEGRAVVSILLSRIQSGAYS